MARHTESQWQEMIDAYLAGKTFRVAAAIHGASAMSLYGQMRRRGIGCRDRSHNTKVVQEDLTGKRFGRLTVRRWIRAHREGVRKVDGKWECDCDCGKVVLARTGGLNSAHHVSCGCLGREKARANCIKRCAAWARPGSVIEAAVADYAAGGSGPDVAARHGVNAVTVIRWAKDANVRVRESREYRTYSLDESAFDEVTGESAYWAGFLLADGCVSACAEKGRRRHSIIVALKTSDAAHVGAFRAFLRSDQPIGCAPDGRFVRFAVDSQRLVDAVAKYGVVPRKSHTAAVPAFLANDHHFWRGVLDGDGSLCWSIDRRRGYTRPVVSLVGSRRVCEAFSAFVTSRCADYAPRALPHKSIWQVRIQGPRAVRLMEEVYASGPALPRKKAAAESFAAWLLARRATPHARP